MNKTKKAIVVFSKQKEQKVQGLGEKRQWLEFVIFREREGSFSLDLRPFGSSVLDGVRSKVALRGEGYAWAPIWWSSNNSKK